MASSRRVIASLVLPAAALADECASATTPEGCLTSSACAWLMLPGLCAASDSAEAAASPADCCSSTAANTTCAHSSSELPDGICTLPPSNGNAAFDLSYATRMAHISGAAYCSQESVASWTCGTHCSTAAGLEMIQYISNEKEVLAGFVAWDPSINAIVVSFRGTVGGITDWVHNLAYTKTNPFDQLPDVGVHHGFWNAWQYLATPTLSAIESIQQSHSGAKVVLTGHSLGAAIAADAALDMAVNYGLATSVVNFGSPRAGNAGFHSALQQYVPDYFRVTHANDIVPHVPPEAFGFFHAETEVFFPGSDTQYQTCNGGEDPSCSDRCAKRLSCISVADHLNYFGVALGGDGCDTPPPPEPMTTMSPTSEPGTSLPPIPTDDDTTMPPSPEPETTVLPTFQPETTVLPTSEPETTVAPMTTESGDDTTMPPTPEPETTVLPTFEPETTVLPTSEPETTVAPMTTEPVDPTTEPQFSTTSPWEPSEPTDKNCRACMTMCAPCRECANGSDGSFAYGSCDKCWHCWDWDDDELEDDDNNMDKDCDALHKDHDWDDDEVRCLTNAVTTTGMDCRACWTKIGEMSVFV